MQLAKYPSALDTADRQTSGIDSFCLSSAMLRFKASSVRLHTTNCWLPHDCCQATAEAGSGIDSGCGALGDMEGEAFDDTGPEANHTAVGVALDDAGAEGKQAEDVGVDFDDVLTKGKLAHDDGVNVGACDDARHVTVVRISPFSL